MSKEISKIIPKILHPIRNFDVEAKKTLIGNLKKYYVTSSANRSLKQVKNGVEPEMVKLFRSLASNSEVIFDIGANIGCTAILFGELAKKVYAFEPSPSTFALLKKNVSEAGLKNVVLENSGLGDQPGEFPLTFAPSNRSGGFVSDRTQASAGHITEKVVINRLDEVVKSLDVPKLDFIKIDVEGFEGHVMRGALQTLSVHKPTVVLELNHWCLNAFQRTSVPDYFELLRSIFPILLAVDGSSYLNLCDVSESYIVMYHHILHLRFPNIVAAFDESRLARFKSEFQHQFVA